MPKRSKKQIAIDRCIIAFLKQYRKYSKVGSAFEGAYFWNEREAQWALFSHLRERTVSRSIGSEWWIHAEGDIERPKYARWSGLKRADIVVIDHSKFKKLFANQSGDISAYETMIELKIIWTGYGVKGTKPGIKSDIRKLANCIDGEKTKEGHFVLLDALDRNRMPYYSVELIEEMLGRVPLRRHKMASRLHLWHWPDSDEPITKISEADWRHYTAASA